MAVLRYASQEAANIKKAESRALQQARLNASIAERKSAAAVALAAAGSAQISPVPAAYDDTGSPGQIASDGTYLYYCHTEDQWGRVAFDATPW